jgi:spermidine synthase
MAFPLIRFLALVITFITGASALVYEVTWQYYLANLLGSQARSTALIVATFLGGLAVGYHLFGRLSQGRSSRWLMRGCGLLEALIGAWALIFPWIYTAVWKGHHEFHIVPPNVVGDLVVAAVLLGLPTMMMGASLPLLTQGLARSCEDAPRLHARIYIVNTAGACAGALSAGFLFLPTYGLSETMMYAGIVNVAVGALLVLLSIPLPTSHELPGLGHDREKASEISSAQEAAPRSTGRMIQIAFVAFLGGLVSITFQSVLIRVVSLSIGASVYAFTLVVSAFILVLAVGAWIFAGRQSGNVPLAWNQLLIPFGLLIVYLVIPYLPYSSHVFRALLTNEWPNFYTYYAGVFVVLSAGILLPVGALGATLPLLFKEGIDRATLLGRRVGVVYGANTLGCVVGAIVGGYLALRYLNLDGVMRLCIGVSSLAVFLVAYRHRGVFQRVVILTSASMIFVSTFLLPPWPNYAMGRGTFRAHSATATTFKGFAEFYKEIVRGYEFEGYKDDPNSTIAVISYGDGSKSILVNGKSDGSTTGGDRVTTKLMAHLPGLLQRSPSDRAAVVGFGTGITVGSLALYDELQQIDVLEISESVRNFAPKFDSANGGASHSPKVAWQLEDAYRFLIETPHTYAIIASEPSNPWVGGVERLYSRDFYDVVKRKLAPGGVYAQWFHAYSISPETMAMVLRTFGSSFNDVHLFERGSDIILLGANDPIDTEALYAMRERFQRSVISDDLKDVGITSLDGLLKREAWIPWEGVSRAPVHTLDKPKLSYSAGRDFFFDAEVSLASFAFAPQYKGWSKKAYQNTLLARLTRHESTIDQIQSFALIACDVLNSESLEWEKRSDPCKYALVALVVQGVLDSNQSVNDEMIKLLQQLAPTSTETPTPPLDAIELGKALDMVGEYGAPFISIDPSKLRSFARRCFELSGESATACRTRLVLALASNGFVQEGQEEFDAMLRDNLPLKSAEHAQSLADVVGIELTPEQRRGIDVANAATPTP